MAPWRYHPDGRRSNLVKLSVEPSVSFTSPANAVLCWANTSLLCSLAKPEHFFPPAPALSLSHPPSPHSTYPSSFPFSVEDGLMSSLWIESPPSLCSHVYHVIVSQWKESLSGLWFTTSSCGALDKCIQAFTLLLLFFCSLDTDRILVFSSGM